MLTAHLLALLLLAAPSAQTCATLRSAHENLLSGSFTVERRMAVTMNGKLKVREVTRLDYTDGQLEVERLELDLRDKNLVIESTQSDPALEASFACERVEVLGDDRFRLRAEDAAEELEFVLDTERKALVPAVWRSREKARFLWKKLRIETEVIYDGLEWRE